RSGLYLVAVFICESGPPLPQWQGKHKDQCQEDLQKRDDPVSSGPSHPAGQSEAHDIRSGSGAKSPHTVEPAHMMAFVMKSHIVVQGGVNASRSQAIGNGPETEHPEGRADGKAEERSRRHPHADGSDFSGSQSPGEPVALEAG